MTTGQPSRQQFGRTHWSLALRFASPESEDAVDALRALCLRYWYPVYAFVRTTGHAPATAEATARRFLQCLFRDCREGGTRQAQGRFRSYLLDRLRAYLAGDLRVADPEERGEFASAPADLESRHARDNAGVESP